MEIDIEKSTAVSSSMDLTNITYDCFNSSSMDIHNATNVTICESNENPKTAWDIVGIVIVSIILGLMTLTTIVGNVFVIAAIILERNLQSVANYLILSLAVADLLVAVLVMPLGAIYEISGEWMFGATLCDMWTTCDLLCCTASILHLLAIAWDRYWAVTQVNYIHQRNFRTIGTMILMIWLTSVIVSLAPLMGWKDEKFMERIEAGKCMISQDVAYQVFATMSTFYVPLLVILILYAKIFMTARNRLRKRAAQKAKVTTFGVTSRNYHNTTNEATEDNNSHNAKCHPPKSESNKLPKLQASNEESPEAQHKSDTASSKQNSKETNAISVMKNSHSSNTVILTTTAATIDPKNHQIQTVVVPNQNGHSQDDSHVNIISNCNQAQCNHLTDIEGIQGDKNGQHPLDNESFSRHEPEQISTSDTPSLAVNKKGSEKQKSPQKYENGENVPLIQISTAGNPASETIGIRECTRPKIISNSLHGIETEISVAGNSVSNHVNATSNTCSSKGKHVKEYQHQACQTEGRSKRHVNFERLNIEEAPTQKPKGVRGRLSLKFLNKGVTKGSILKRYLSSNVEEQVNDNENGNGQVLGKGKNNPMYSKEKKHVSLEVKRERKAAKTLAIVTGAFIACWLPFFILALVMPIFQNVNFPGVLVSFFLWLGYFNSTLNPMIYTVFSPEFRQAFQRILCGKSAAQNHRPRHLQ